MGLTQYWLFAVVCVVVMLWLVRMVLKERLTLQGSLFFFFFLALAIAVALLPRPTAWLVGKMGFQLESNFIFVVSIGALATAHVLALITLSKVELRSIALTQEIGILRERLEKIEQLERRS